MKRSGGKPIVMCESAAQQETGLIITLGLLSSPTRSQASLQQRNSGRSRILISLQRPRKTREGGGVGWGGEGQSK